MTHILVVEDDPILGKGVVFNLESEGYEVTWARDLETAFQVSKTQRLNGVVLDLGLPDGDGLDFCRYIREQNHSLPILVLTAQIEEESAVKSLGAGADDYIRKPFGNAEFLLRLKKHLGETKVGGPQVRFGGISIFTDKRAVYFDNQTINFNRREFDLLLYMVRNAETVVTREVLMDSLGIPDNVMDRTIDSQLSHIRSKLKKIKNIDVKISSVYGVGYKLEKK